MVWTDRGESASWPPGRFELGLLSDGDWSALWIEPVEHDVGPPGERVAMMLRGEFRLDRSVQSARLYASAHGIYELFANGTRVGDLELTPGFTEYRKLLQVHAFDVADTLIRGDNAIGVLLSDGWFRGQVTLTRAHDQWGSRLAFLCQLQVRYDDGSRAVFGTGEGWRSNPSHIDGADLDHADSTPTCGGFRPAGAVGVRRLRMGTREHQRSWLRTVGRMPSPPVRAVENLVPISVRRVNRGQVFDLGQNINGWVRLTELGPEGTAVRLIHGEAVSADGDVTTAHLDVNVPFLPHPLPAGQIDRFVSSGRSGEVFEPRHTTHGFRYVRVEGHPARLTTDDLTGVVVHSDMERTGWFSCDDDRINRLHEAAVWSFRGNACDVPTDCPTRERGSWTGDWQIFVATAAFIYDVAGFSRKWLRDLTAEQWSNGLVANLAPSPLMSQRAGS